MELKKHDLMILVGGISGIGLTLSLFFVSFPAGMIGMLIWVSWALLHTGDRLKQKEWDARMNRWREAGIYDKD